MLLRVATIILAGLEALASASATSPGGRGRGRRKLEGHPSIPAFGPLTCNDDLATADCSVTPLSSLVDAGSGGEAVIPCGTCSYLDVAGGSTLTVPGGVCAEGRLFVPPEADGVLNTTAVVVRGELEIVPPADGNKVTVTLFGTDDVLYIPPEGDGTALSSQCGYDDASANGTAVPQLPCNLGKKPIAVVGGKLKVDALPHSDSPELCPSWVKLLDKSELSPAPADDFVGEYDPVAKEGADGDAENGGEGFFGIASWNERYPSKNDALSVSTDDDDEGANHFLKFDPSSVTYNSAIRIKLKTDAARTAAVGETLTLSYKYRVRTADGQSLPPGEEWWGQPYIRWARYSRPKGTRTLPACSPTDAATTGDWAECRVQFLMEPVMATSNYWWDLNLRFVGNNMNPEAGRELNYDDIRVERLEDVSPKPDVLHVGTEAASSSCWNAGDEVLITPSGSNQNGHAVRSVASVDGEKGTVTLTQVVDPLENELFSVADLDPHGESYAAVEVARLTRPVVFRAQDDDEANPDHGGHLIVYHTPGVAQTLRGVEIVNFGQEGLQGRYPIHVHVSKDVEGTQIIQNVVRGSNQRAVVVHGSHNVTVYDNVAYDITGHSFMLEDGGEWDNEFERNIACFNRQSSSGDPWAVTDASEVASFFLSSPGNHFIGNVAAGSLAHGFWFHLMKVVGGPSAYLAVNQGHVPRSQNVLTFRDNYAHSNAMHGVTSLGNQYQFRAGWNAQPNNLLENTHSYKNTKDAMHLSQTSNTAVVGGVYADSDRCINIGLGSPNVEVRHLTCTAASAHVRESNGGEVVCHWGWDRNSPDEGHAGISTTIYERGSRNAEIENVTFKGWSGIEHCWGGKGTALNILDDENLPKHWIEEPRYLGSFSFDGPAFDIKCGFLQWAKTKSPPQGYVNVFVNDVDGSIGRSAVATSGGPGAFLVRPSMDPYGSAFVDGCTVIDLPDSCAMFCEGVCMRRIFVENDPDHSDYVMVVRDTSSGATRRYNRTVASPNYPRWKQDFDAILPGPGQEGSGGPYEISFENEAGAEDWPAYARLKFGTAPACSNYADEASVSLALPDSVGMGLCSSMTRNGDLQTGTRTGWHTSWFGTQIVQETNSTNYYLKTTNRKLTRSNLYTWIDFSCLKPLETYRVSGRFRLQNSNGVDVGCSANVDYPTGCPSVSVYFTQNDDQNSPIQGYGLGKIPDIMGDGAWTDFSFDWTLDEGGIPPDAYQALVIFRGFKSGLYLLDDFRMEHVAVDDES